jgi:hypothetical protein
METPAPTHQQIVELLERLAQIEGAGFSYYGLESGRSRSSHGCARSL